MFFTLYSVNMCIKEGELVAVIGPVGSGKSSLLTCLFGEMHKATGDIYCNVSESSDCFILLKL